MSVEPQALERSVLERKEREELATIAEAMGVKSAARASKATLIDQILTEAGVEAPVEKPRRSRARTQAPSGNGAADGDAVTGATPPPATDDGAPPPPDAAASGSAGAAEVAGAVAGD